MLAYPSRIRKYRKSAPLSQGELSLLAGIRSQGLVSEFEAGLKRPGLAVAMANEIVFGVQTRDLFPHLHAQTTRRVLNNAKRLQTRMTSDAKRRDADAYLTALIERLTNDLAQI
jgi:transcriptional regulator with XRE-family HTH domain